MSNKIIMNAISAVLAIGLTSVPAGATAEVNSGKDMMTAPPLKGMERCYGIAKAGKNDCGSSNHTCSGEAKLDGHKKEWLFVPNGLCSRIVGGTTTPEAES